MQRLIKSLLERNTFVIAIALTVLIAFLSLSKPPTEIHISIRNIDKIFHTIAYFSLALSWFFAIKKAHKINSYQVLISILVIIYGIIIEVLQGTFTTIRQSDYYDVLANTLGVLLAFIVFNGILKKIKAI